MIDPHLIAQVVPLVIVGAVLAWRLRGMSRPQPMRPGRLWIMPVVMAAIAAVVLALHPPQGGAAWLWVLVGGGAGAALGWQRARLMRLAHDPATGTVMMRQSPAGILLVVGLLAFKRVLGHAVGADPAGGAALSPQALILTDALLVFAVAMVGALRAELWRRSRGLGPAL